MTPEEFLQEWRSSDAWINVSSSGSTGVPKAMRLPKSLVRESALRTNKFFSISSASTLHLPLSPDYIAGKMMIVRALEAGAKLSFENPSNRILKNHATPITLLAIVPSQLSFLLSAPYPLPEIENIIVGGSPIPHGLAEAAAKSGIASHIYETYGMTETASHIALRELSAEPQSFKPFKGISVSRDARDCLRIDLGSNYAFVQTNDIACIHPDGSFDILGRIDNVIISGGKKIFPEQVEALCSPYFEGNAVATTSLPDSKWGEILVLAIERKEPLSPKEASSFFDKVAEKTDRWMIPKLLVSMPQLPRLQNQKLDRKRLQEIVAQTPAQFFCKKY